jgi:hypothetical protein
MDFADTVPRADMVNDMQPAPDAQAAKRRKVRKGTRSCWECRRRKVKCIFTMPQDTKCTVCTRRHTTCIGQETLLDEQTFNHIFATPNASVVPSQEPNNDHWSRTTNVVDETRHASSRTFADVTPAPSPSITNFLVSHLRRSLRMALL